MTQPGNSSRPLRRSPPGFHPIAISRSHSQCPDGLDFLARILYEARKAQNLTQMEVARKLGWKQTFISRVERGETRPDVLEFVLHAQALGVDWQALIEHVLALGWRLDGAGRAEDAPQAGTSCAVDVTKISQS